MKTILEEHWHHLPAAEVTDFLETASDRGLDTFEVGHRQEQFGPNSITQKKGKSPLVLFLLQFHQPLVYILLAAAAVTSVLQEWVDAGIILGVVLVNAIIGFIQEAKAVKAIEALAQSLTTTATVLRGGERRQIPATELVPGDIVSLQSGDRVPADLRLLATRELQIDESTLTGESVAVQKQSRILPHDTLLADRSNMAYSSTLVTYGIATGVVVATGNSTEIGRINELIASAEILATPLTKKITRFSGLLLYMILGLAVITFVVGILRGEAWMEMFMAVVALAVGAIPEGLPAAVTITLAIGVAKMARRNAIIRKLPAVETLGSTTVICSDKTGTLTQNQMTVQEVCAGGDLFLFSGTGYVPEGRITRDGETINLTESKALRECLISGLLCNDANLIKVGDDWRVEGDPTEAALVVAARKAGFEREQLCSELPRLDAIPFESQYQYMATLHGNRDRHVVYLKGSVESVLARCGHALSRTGELIALEFDNCHRAAAQMAEKGLRVLAFASGEREISSARLEHDEVAGMLTFLGLQGMIDPPRPEAVAAVRVCQTAGIRVKMITGDHAITAAAIARQIGLIGETGESGQAMALNGRDIAALTDTELIAAVESCAVFARVAPEQKLRLVEALQATGNIVAMTGDGVNDAPALRQADIGVAMGITGTDVSKEAAAMILLDDNFATIVKAVKEGRRIFDNIRKFIKYTMTSNSGEIWTIALAPLLGLPIPLLPIHILWINLVTDGLPGLALAAEPAEKGIMERPPRHPTESIFAQGLGVHIIWVGLLMGAVSIFTQTWFLKTGQAHWQTMVFTVLCLSQMGHVLAIRSERESLFSQGIFSNKPLVGAFMLTFVLQMATIYVPQLNIVFKTTPLTFGQLAVTLALSTVVFFAVELEKLVKRRRT